MLAPDGGEPAAELVEAARRVAADVLEPAAQNTDQAPAVPGRNFRALRDAGLFSSPVPREVYEILAGACGVTFFTWVQHHAPVRLLAASPNTALAAEWLPRLTSGEVMGGVAFAHLRRPGPPALVARPAPGGGWTLHGEAPWVTGWGPLGPAGVFAVAARHDDRVLFVLVLRGAPEGLRASLPMRLLAMTASSTVRLRFDGLAVPVDDVIVALSFDEWLSRDRVGTAQPNPAAFGVAATAIRLLRERDPGLADDLEAERLACRAESYAADPVDVDCLLPLRAHALELAQRAAYALVVATGGRAMLLDHPAQRLLREAAFYAIQAQTGALRAATLDRLTR